MKSEKDILDLIRQKFPRQDSRIGRLYEEDADFRSLCLDYFSSLQNLLKYKKLSEAEVQSIEEYQNVLTELEKELYDFLFP